MESLICAHCNRPFSPNKYSPRQKVCSEPGCQKKRQLESMQAWRERNPSYFKYDESKSPDWLENQRNRSRQWRAKNPDKVRYYRQSHSGEYRKYMREYMRQYRERRKGPEGGASSPQPPAAPGNGIAAS